MNKTLKKMRKYYKKQEPFEFKTQPHSPKSKSLIKSQLFAFMKDRGWREITTSRQGKQSVKEVYFEFEPFSFIKFSLIGMMIFILLLVIFGEGVLPMLALLVILLLLLSVKSKSRYVHPLLSKLQAHFRQKNGNSH